MKLALKPPATSQIVHVFILDSASTTGAGKTALVFGDITAYYVRAGGTLTALTMETIATLGTWASTGDNKLGFKLLHDTNAPGIYELDLPNNILAAGSSQVVIQLRATGAVPTVLEIQLANVSVATTGYALASDGLDSISTTAPTGVATNFRQMLVQLWRLFFKRRMTSAGRIDRTYADDGSTVVTTQHVTDDGTDRVQEAAS